LFGRRKRGTSEFFVVPVTSRDEGTLHLLILKYIKLHTIIYSDSFSVYVNNRTRPKTSKLEKYGYIHFFVNHKIEFISSLCPEVHTNTVESMWKDIKTFLKKMRNTSKFMFAITRYYFAKQISKEVQLDILIKNLHKQEFYNSN
jgi:transposase-like protein